MENNTEWARRATGAAPFRLFARLSRRSRSRAHRPDCTRLRWCLRVICRARTARCARTARGCERRLRAWHANALENAAPSSPHTTTRLVTSCADDGQGSLRAVVTASASGDTVDLSRLSCSAITLETGAIAVRIDSVTLIGPRSRALSIDGNHADRVFLHYGYSRFLLRNLTVRNGYDRATGFHLAIGGCIASAGYLTLDHTTVTDCYAGGEGAYGGAIYAYSLIMSSSTLSRNEAYGVHPAAGTAAFGGAAFVYQVDLVGSTVTGNHARHRLNPSCAQL